MISADHSLFDPFHQRECLRLAGRLVPASQTFRIGDIISVRRAYVTALLLAEDPSSFDAAFAAKISNVCGIESHKTTRYILPL